MPHQAGRHRLLLGVAALVTATSLTACGGSNAPAASEAEEPAQAGTSAPPSPAASPTPATPAGPEAIHGTFHIVQKVTKSSIPSRKVGATTPYDSTFTSTCAEACTTMTALINGQTLKFVAKGDHWVYEAVQKTDCMDAKGKKVKPTAEWRDIATYRLDPASGSQPRTISGTVTTTLTRDCQGKPDKPMRSISKSTGTQQAG